MEYLVYWKGYTDEEYTWEPIGNLTGAPEAIKNFHKYSPSAP